MGAYLTGTGTSMKGERGGRGCRRGSGIGSESIETNGGL